MKYFYLFVFLLIVVLHATGQKEYTANTLRLDTTLPRSNYTIQDVSWIAGQWKGIEDSTISEEHWMKPDGNTMVGMFRMVQAGKPYFYELMTILTERRQVVLRLKHFHVSLRGWEHKDSTGVSFPLLKVEGKKAFFDGQTYFLEDQNTLVVFLAQTNREGKLTEQVFRFKRVF